jgi:hypothetical protein
LSVGAGADTAATAGLNFGFFLSAQVAGEAVADGALYRSTQANATTTTGGPTVPTDGDGSVRAVYAQAYQGENGKRYVVLINKGASNLLATISDSPLDRADERDLYRATLNQTFFDLVNGRMDSRHPDQSCVHRLAQRPTAILPPRRSLTVTLLQR